MPKFLSADEILKAEDRKTETVPVPEWAGGDPDAVVIVREMNGTERDKFDTSVRDEQDKLNLDNYRARLVAATACDEAGTLLFTQSQVAALGRKSSVVLTRVFRVAQKLNGMTVEAVKDAKKDSEPAASDVSPSVSPSPAGPGT